ncbi:MAG: glycosyl hydrolase-related protein [Clostridia bacterium]
MDQALHCFPRSLPVVRAYNPLGRETRAVLRPMWPVKNAVRVNLHEDHLSPTEVAEDGSVELALAPHKIVTVELSCARLGA